MKRLFYTTCVGAHCKSINCSKYFQILLLAITTLSVIVGLQAVSSAKDNKFYCQTEVREQGKTMPATIVRAKRGNEIRIIYWRSEYFSKSGGTPAQRCKDTSQQFQKYYDNDWLKYIRTDEINNLGIICVARIKGSKCTNKDIIVTLPPNVNRFEALGTLLDLRRIAAGRPLYLTDQLITYENGEAYINIDILLNRSSTLQAPI
jgi:hypothetical protein